MEFTAEQASKVMRRLSLDLEAWLKDRTVEPHYSAASAAEMLEVSERTIWNYVDAWTATGGKEGIGPVVKLSHKAVRIPASAINRFLAQRRVVAPEAAA